MMQKLSSLSLQWNVSALVAVCTFCVRAMCRLPHPPGRPSCSCCQDLSGTIPSQHLKGLSQLRALQLEGNEKLRGEIDRHSLLCQMRNKCESRRAGRSPLSTA